MLPSSVLQHGAEQIVGLAIAKLEKSAMCIAHPLHPLRAVVSSMAYIVFSLSLKARTVSSSAAPRLLIDKQACVP